MKAVILSFLLFVLCAAAYAQETRYSTTNEQAIKHFALANEAMDENEFGVAITELKQAISDDNKFIEAHLQLGNLHSDQQKYAEAIPEYRRALELNSDLADAHYRLGQAYVHTGEKDKAQEQLQVYQKLREQHLADLDKQRAEVRQFVYAAKDVQPGRP